MFCENFALNKNIFNFRIIDDNNNSNYYYNYNNDTCYNNNTLKNFRKF